VFLTSAMTEVVGIDHIYIAASDLSRSEIFYDSVLLDTLGFRKKETLNKSSVRGEVSNHLSKPFDTPRVPCAELVEVSGRTDFGLMDYLGSILQSPLRLCASPIGHEGHT
jgi:hypothetical protein